MRELLEYLARALVDEPESVSVEQFEEDDGTIVLELAVAEDDYGKIIGRGGGGAHTPPAGRKGGGGPPTRSGRSSRRRPSRRTGACSSTSSTDVAGADQEWLAGGRVGRPHGLDGSFYVLEARAALLTNGVRVRVAGREADVVRRAGTDERPILRLAGVEGRD